MYKLFALVIALAFSSNLAAQPSPYVAVYDDIIAAGKVQLHLDALAEFKQAKAQTDYASSYTFYRLGARRIPALHPVATLEFTAQADASWEAMKRPFDADFLATNGEVYERTVEAQEFYVMQYQPELSYQAEFEPSAWPYLVWKEFDVIGTEPGRGAAIKALTELSQLDAEVESPLRYRVYRKRHGPGLPVISILYYAASRADFDRASEQVENLRGEAGVALLGELSRHSKLLRESGGLYIPEISH